jgi:hypothetical protein
VESKAVECQCPCHAEGSGIIHFAACCDGQCRTCGKWFESGLLSHGCPVEHTPPPWTAVKLAYRDGTLEFENPADLPLVLAAPEMLDMLRELEWEGDMEGEQDICPMCGADWGEGEGHVPNCRLASLIARATNDATPDPPQAGESA